MRAEKRVNGMRCTAGGLAVARRAVRVLVMAIVCALVGVGVGVRIVPVSDARASTITRYDPGPITPSPSSPRPTHAPSRVPASPHSAALRAASSHARVPTSVHARTGAQPSASAVTTTGTGAGAGIGASSDADSAPAAGELAVDSSDADSSASAPSSSGDPLVSNGLGSPLCRDPAISYALSPTARRNCDTSGFVAAAEPIGNYGLDVHINTGALGLGNLVATVVQDILITPCWMGLVWVVHTLIVAIEWAYTLDLLDSSATSGIARGLRETQATFTQPWLVIMLAVASMFAAYQGLLRRRVAETLGEVALMLAMICVGLWVIANPFGTVGALERWANQAALGTLGAVAHGTPEDAPRTLADSMGTVFDAVIGTPWCYMEFGDVNWCRDRARMDPRLRSAALVIAAQEHQHADLLRRARTNGGLFLALPANQWERNAIGNESSLLRVICRSSNDDGCTGSAAQEAEFRTPSGTWPRAAGLLLIVIGSFGMMMVSGFLVMRLLGAAIMSLLYLLLAPAMVLAPALGDGGRAAFRAWGAHLLAAVGGKLIYSFLLGVVLLLMQIVLSLSSFGWWTQWLLLTVLWWSSFHHRHQLFRMAAQTATDRSRGATERLGSALRTTREVGHAADWVKRRHVQRELKKSLAGKKAAQGVREQNRYHASKQVDRTLDQDVRGAKDALAAHSPTRMSAKQRRLERMRKAEHHARASGDHRHALRLEVRGARVAKELADQRDQQQRAQRTVADAEQAQRSGHAHDPRKQAERARFLDAQAALPAARAPRAGDASRDYPALAGLVGRTQEEFRRLDAPAQRSARLQIDRELALHKELNAAARPAATGGELSKSDPSRRDGRSEHQSNVHTNSAGNGRATDRVASAHSGSRAERRGGSSAKQSAGEAQADHAGESSAKRDPRHPPRHESPVMRDARAVAEGRKRQLGWSYRE